MKKIHRSPFFPNACSYSYCILIRRICLLNLSRETRKKKVVCGGRWRLSCVHNRDRKRERQRTVFLIVAVSRLWGTHAHTKKADSFLYGCLSLETLNWRRWAPSRALFDFHLPDSLSNQPSHANDLKRMYVSFPFGNWRPLFFFLFVSVRRLWLKTKQNGRDVVEIDHFQCPFCFPFYDGRRFTIIWRRKKRGSTIFFFAMRTLTSCFFFFCVVASVHFPSSLSPTLPRASNCFKWWGHVMTSFLRRPDSRHQQDTQHLFFFLFNFKLSIDFCFLPMVSH